MSRKGQRGTPSGALLMSVATVLLAACAGNDAGRTPEVDTPPANARFVRRIDWLETGVWLRADTHVHSRFSDGRWPVERVLAEAAARDCDVVAVTDHAHRQYEAATPAYAEAIDRARRERPDMIVLSGLEWNVPPFGGAEHATLLVAPGPDEWATLAGFREMFDDDGTKPVADGLAREAVRWLSARADVQALVLYNHPSRKLARSLDLLPIYRDLQAGGDVVVGFSGSPGHQEFDPPGAYRSGIELIDRWDPAVAVAGDAWDTLLVEGRDVWAARAPSDFHRSDPKRPDDYWPCEFSETWLLAPERTATGVMRALQAGTFFGAHGRIAREVRLAVAAPGLDRPAGAGEIIEATPGTRLELGVFARVPALDWQERPNRIDVVEVFLARASGTEILTLEAVPGDADRFSGSIVLTDTEVVIRARGRRQADDAGDLLFYTNPVRVTLP